MGVFDFIFNRNANGEEKAVKPQKITKRTIKQQIYRFNQEIANWKLGIESFEDVYNPINIDLIRVYNDVMLDAHLSSVVSIRKSKILGKDHKIVDENGEEIVEQSEIFQTIWFNKVLSLALDSKFYGHSLIQLGSRIGKSFEKVYLIDREYVVQQYESVRVSPYSNEPKIPYNKGKYMPWLIPVGESKDLGLLVKASPLVIFKKTALSSWAEFAELFGAPLRVGKTNVRDETLRDNMYNMLDQMGGTPFAVLDKDDIIEFVSDNKNDAYQVYDKLTERINSELSKLFLGSTMVSDNGSSRSQSEVHERTTKEIAKEDALFIQDFVNTCFIPHINKFHGFNITGKWVFDDSEQVSKQEQFERDIEIIKTGKYKVPVDYIRETYGTPVEEIEEKEESAPEQINNLVNSKKKVHLSKVYDLYLKETFCDYCSNELESSDVPPIDWEDDFINKLVNDIYAGVVTVKNLPEELYLRIGELINSAALTGIDEANILTALDDEDFKRALKNNAFKFSGAKTFQQVKEMSDFILDENGNLRNFGDYEAKAKEIFDTYNRNWLRTEVAQASNSAQMASKWQEFEEDKDFLPYLRYITQGDQRVRPDHKELDGVIKKVDSPFWDVYYPPNGWNCRCNVLQEAEGKETKDGKFKLPEVPDSMRVNVGKKKVLFGPQHPYFIVEDQFKEDLDNNFGFDIP